MHVLSNFVCASQTGYNLVFWLWKYSFDADCDLFLKILRGEVREDVYLSQKGLQVCPFPLKCIQGLQQLSRSAWAPLGD